MHVTSKDGGVRNWSPPQQLHEVGQILLDYDNLRDLGITYSKEHLRRLETAGQFPERVRLTPSRIAWMFNEVMAWINDRAQVRSIETGNQETREVQ